MSSVSEKYDLDCRTREEPVFASYLMKLSVLPPSLPKSCTPCNMTGSLAVISRAQRKELMLFQGSSEVLENSITANLEHRYKLLGECMNAKGDSKAAPLSSLK